MAKQAADHFTLDLLDKPKRGRPRKPDALTDAQRARAYRARKRALAHPDFRWNYFCRKCGWNCSEACKTLQIEAFLVEHC